MIPTEVNKRLDAAEGKQKYDPDFETRETASGDRTNDFLKKEIQRIKLKMLADPKGEQKKKIKRMIASGEH